PRPFTGLERPVSGFIVASAPLDPRFRGRLRSFGPPYDPARRARWQSKLRPDEADPKVGRCRIARTSVAPCPTTSPPTVDTSEPGSDDVRPPSRKQRRGDATPCALARRRVAADQRSPMLVPAQRVALGSEGPPFLASRPIVHD